MKLNDDFSISTPPAPPRAQWPRLLLSCPAATVRELAHRLAQQHTVEDIQIAQSGLGLLKLSDSALGDAYYPGEIPLASAHVRVTATDGRSVEGAAQLLDDRASLARAIAVIDAAVSGRLPGHEAAHTLFASGQARLDEQSAARRALLTATRVDFSLVGSTEEDEYGAA